jgi:hypothetical protein
VFSFSHHCPKEAIMKLSISSLFHRAQASFRKPVVAPVAQPRAMKDAKLVADVYRQFGPRIAREMVRSSRAKEPSTDGSPSWSFA